MSEIIKKKLYQMELNLYFQTSLKLQIKIKFKLIVQEFIETDLIFIVTELDKIEEFFEKKFLKKKVNIMFPKYFFIQN